MAFFLIGVNEITRSIGWVYWLKGDYQNAIKFYKESLKNLKDISIDTHDIHANILINLGNIYWEKQEWKKSIDFFNKSIDIFMELKNNYKVARIHNNIGCIYAETGALDKALGFFSKAILLSEDLE